VHRNGECSYRNVFQRQSCALCIDTPTTDAAHAVGVLQDVTVAREGKGYVLVRDDQDGVEHPAEVLVAAPLLGKLDARAQQLGRGRGGRSSGL
jgi:hypothetical protein